MSMNMKPIFPLTPKISWAADLQAALTGKDGTDAILLCTAHATNGSRVDYVRVRATGTNTATVLRLFINNGSTSGTATNNTLFTEVTIAATTLSEVAALAETTIQLDLGLPAGYRLYVSNGTAVAALLKVSAVYGDY